MSDVVVYSTPQCPVCKMLKAYLQERDVEFGEMNMATAEGLTELRCGGVYTVTAPVLCVDDIFYEKDRFYDEDKGMLVNLEDIV